MVLDLSFSQADISVEEDGRESEACHTESKKIDR